MCEKKKFPPQTMFIIIKPDSSHLPLRSLGNIKLKARPNNVLATIEKKSMTFPKEEGSKLI